MRTGIAYGLGTAGGALGVAAGLAQATIGSRIPEWTGNKQAPLALGLLTIVLSVVSLAAAAGQRRPGVPAPMRAVYAFAMAGTGLLCLSTAGRLWWPSAVLLIAAAAFTLDGLRHTASLLAANWSRILLGALGGCEWLMAAGAAPAAMVVGLVGGGCLIAAAWPARLSPRSTWALIAVGTVPFAAIAWTAIVPLLLPVEASVTALTIRRSS